MVASEESEMVLGLGVTGALGVDAASPVPMAAP